MDFYGISFFERTLQTMRQEESAALKLRKHRVTRFSASAHARCLQHPLRLARELPLRRVEKLGVLSRRNRPEQQCSNMHRSVARGPFQALQTLRHMRGRRRLSPPITPDSYLSHDQAEC